jgi:hypothetical protein
LVQFATRCLVATRSLDSPPNEVAGTFHPIPRIDDPEGRQKVDSQVAVDIIDSRTFMGADPTLSNEH